MWGDAQGKLKNKPGCLGKVHLNQYKLVWTLWLAFNNQHRARVFAQDLLGGRPEKQFAQPEPDGRRRSLAIRPVAPAHLEILGAGKLAPHRAVPARPARARQRRARRCRCARRDARHGRDASSPTHRRPARRRDSTAPRSHTPGRRGRGREQAVEVDGRRVGRRCQPWPFAAKVRASAGRCSSGSWSPSLRDS